jgi:hypothetical protein
LNTPIGRAVDIEDCHAFPPLLTFPECDVEHSGKPSLRSAHHESGVAHNAIRSKSMEIPILLLGGMVLYAVIRLYPYTNTRRYEQVVTLKAGETFLGVIDRGKRDCLFIGDAPGRIYRHLTAEDIKLLKQVLEPESE